MRARIRAFVARQQVGEFGAHEAEEVLFHDRRQSQG
jgi:hypothetical protein